MGLTVFAESMGFFHKGSGGKGIAPGDVCLSPPPPPAGPVPVPYVNMLQASDLIKGSKSVKIDGEPTALENASEIMMSSGDEGGVQGGNVVTHKIKGKGFFMLWSFLVKVEGKGVGRHGDPMGQAAASAPAGACDMSALVRFKRRKAFSGKKKCSRHYERAGKGYGPTTTQTAHIQGKPCWVIGPTGARCGKPGKTADHQPPIVIAWYKGGCRNGAAFKRWAVSNAAVQPQCANHSLNNVQKGMAHFTRGNPTIAQVQQRIKTYLA
ncbi:MULTISPECIES: PAAR-like domain-containing protein [unclassified Mesorhizobium]|uniref:PAAR-like domain-containing protein n=1 Tax=unclassified Mesorhizobium TaxID=325217 RepID=UPI0004AD2C67|nr:PAAR-like domain-containing protein [Mesorhizobium sp. WSM1293]